MATLLLLLAAGGCGSSTTGKGDCASDPASCACTSDTSCKDPTPRCDTRTGRCVPCLPTADNCPVTQHCVAAGDQYACVAQESCTAALDCPRSGQLAGLCCSGKCADPLNDNNHCGACGNTCGDVPNGKGGCVDGACGVTQCNAGFGDCDKKPANGCESDVTSNVQHCGDCGTSCKATPNTKVTCVAGQCQFACSADFADCDGNASNGCETSTTTNPLHCGGCGMACPALANTSSVACVNSTCVPGVCLPGFFDCDRMSANGCEADVRADPNHCSGCGRKCGAVMNGAAGCNSGVCGVGKCNAGFGDCDGDVLNGCEQDVLSSLRHCGACGATCAVANGVPVCNGGVCTVQACNQGFADCDGKVQTGCETAISRDVANCGACGNVCAQGLVCVAGSCTCPPCNFNNAQGACVNLKCAIASCNAGWADCNGLIQDGCEQNTNTDVRHCGGCGMACPMGAICSAGMCACPPCNIPNSKTKCVNFACVFDGCLAGFADCNNNAQDGCEVNLNADPKNCSACGKPCPANNFCVAGACVQQPLTFVSDATWKHSTVLTNGWEQPGFNDGGWSNAVDEGQHGTAPWNNINAFNGTPAHWIWYYDSRNSGDTSTTYFRKSFTAIQPNPTLTVTADDNYVVYLDGVQVAQSNDVWSVVHTFAMNLTPGKSYVMAVQAKNTGGPGGLLLDMH